MDRWIRAIAGIFVLGSIGLGYYVSPWWFLLTVYVGVNLYTDFVLTLLDPRLRDDV